ncbi:hypothetical protein SESBI_37214 [Sesbania bispinosa]|nr:hypothetical protein SESBI_37214 [Sesbania bispinosa]
MGNCAFKGISSTVLDEEKMVVKVVTSNGGMMELCTPITVECITNEFPGHGIYRSRRDLFSEPLHHNEELHAGELYYLLPLNPFSRFSSNKTITRQLSLTPYRMSTYDNNKNKNKKLSAEEAEVFPRRGVWKVKLVISREQLSEILSEESRTEELIESVRTVAKCGNGLPSVSNSDHLSVSSSSKGPITNNLGLDGYSYS